MYEKLRIKVDELFENAPNTKSAYEIKEEFMANLTDRYDDLIAEGKYGYFPALQGEEIVPLPMEVAISSLKVVPLDSPLLDIARSLGTCMGD